MSTNLVKLMFVVSGLAITLLSARSAPLSDTEKAIIAVLLGNKSSFYSVGGTVTYLASGKTLTLQLNGGSNLSISSNGGFTFSEDVMGGDNYQVTVLSQPAGQTCTVNNGAGSVEDDIKNVSVTCDSGSTYAAIIRGRTIDGYIQGANVFLDINGNGTLDSDEPSGSSGEGGRFEIGLNGEQAACKALAPVVADVPVGAIDETEGEVTEAYQMALPPGTDAIQSGNEVNITPLTSILWAELLALYSSGALPGISCAELENNSDAQEELQRKIDETIANAVRAYNVPESDLLSDYMASGATNAQRTAEDIVTGLKWSLREKIRLEGLYASNTGVRVVIKKVTGGSVNDPSIGSSEYGWYREWFVNDGGLLRSGVARLSDDLSSELYILFYKEVYPYTENQNGAEFQYAREMARTNEHPGFDYVCVGFERVQAKVIYDGNKGRMEYGVENSTSTEVNRFEDCDESVHNRSLISQNLTVTEWTYGRVDGIFKEQGYYSFAGNAAPLPQTQGIAISPEVISGDEIISELSPVDWRFPQPASLQASFTSKHLETNGQQIVIEKFTDPNAQWRRLEQLANGTSLEQWAYAPFDTPQECIEWQGAFDDSGNYDVTEECDNLTRHTVTPSAQGSGEISPASAVLVPAGSRYRFSVKSALGAKLQSVGGSCGGQMHGTTFLTDEVQASCSVAALFETSDDEEVAQCENESWSQLGSDILGEQVPAGDGDGAWSVGMNAVGDRIAIGARYNDEGGNHSGQVRVFEWNGATWEQLGQDMAGAAGETMGWDVALDADGDTVVVGAPCERGGCTSGYVRIYDLAGTTWVQRGQDITGLAAGDREGWAVDISDDGLRVLASSERGTREGVVRSGRARVFDWNATTWSQSGDSVYGPMEFSYPRVGRLSRDGSHIVVGYNSADLEYVNSGRVTVSALSGDSWQAVGSNISGSNESSISTSVGIGVALSLDNGTLAIGSLEGMAVFDFSGDTWIQRGSNILGPSEDSSQLGWGIELRDSGNRVIASSVDGLMGAWQWKTDRWVQIGGWMGNGGRGARDIGASSDGTRAVVAQSGFNSRQGRVQVYELSGCP